MLNFVKRLALIVCGFAVASLVTGFALQVCGVMIVRDPYLVKDFAKPESSIALAFFIALFAVTPAGLVVALAELRRWRMAWYFALAGGVIGLALGAMFRPPAWFPWFGALFGPIAGLVYWAIAGRGSGLAATAPRWGLAALVLIPAASLVVPLLWRASGRMLL